MVEKIKLTTTFVLVLQNVKEDITYKLYNVINFSQQTSFKKCATCSNEKLLQNRKNKIQGLKKSVINVSNFANIPTQLNLIKLSTYHLQDKKKTQKTHKSHNLREKNTYLMCKSCYCICTHPKISPTSNETPTYKIVQRQGRYEP
jgi:hypothetical protein